MTTISDIFGALRRIAEAVARNDRDGYLMAVTQARIVGATEEQIADAYTYTRNRLRTGPDFTRYGEWK